MNHKKTNNIEIVEYLNGPVSAKHQKGLFATSNIKKGDLILVEKAFITQNYRSLSKAELEQSDLLE